jgi:hypothetical protein
MIPERYEPVRQWLMREFLGCREVEVSTIHDAASLLPPGAPALPYVSGEPVTRFRVIEHEPHTWQRELAIARPALSGYSAEQILGVLEREDVARRLRVSPEHRLFLDRQLKVDTLGTTWTGTEAGGGPIRGR